MGNPQLTGAKDGIKILCRNAAVGDGNFWKHPECVNYKLIWVSITPELLEAKRLICPSLFGTGVRLIDTSKPSGRFPNAKPIYRLASLVDPTISEYATKTRSSIVSELTLEDVALWYLDDGGCFIRKDVSRAKSYRFYLCVGDTCNTEQKQEQFLEHMKSIFNTEQVGRVVPNNSKATVNNKTWYIPTCLGRQIAEEAKKFGVLDRKIPQA